MVGCTKNTDDKYQCGCLSYCEVLFTPDGIITDVISEGPIQYKFPCYNPNDGNEFVFFYKNHLSNKSQLVKYNLTTHEKVILVNNFSIINPPKWASPVYSAVRIPSSP